MSSCLKAACEKSILWQLIYREYVIKTKMNHAIETKFTIVRLRWHAK